jgi:PPOX class probable F420-dependent enzyme
MAVLDPKDRHHRQVETRLRDELIVWLTTVGGDGQPQSVPVWFLWDGESFRIFSQPGKPKLANIRKNSRVGLHLQATEGGSDVVIFEGTAEIIEGPPANDLPDYIKKYSRQIEKYGWTPKSFAEDYSEPLRIRPDRLRAW